MLLENTRIKINKRFDVNTGISINILHIRVAKLSKAAVQQHKEKRQTMSS